MPPEMSHRFHIVDVFAEERYAGNPLAVVRDAADLDTATMQRIAREFGFSETTFVVSDPRASEPGVRVRIFTPAEELPFAGHPTLGTAWVIREHLAGGRPAALPLALGVGRVPVGFEPDSGGELAWLSAPPIRLGATLDPARIAPALGLAAADVRADLPVQHLHAGIEFLHVPLASVAAVSKARLEPAAYAPLASAGFPTGVYWFARAGEGELRARMQWFARADEARAVREDPATGSAAACLGAYLYAHTGAEVALRIAQGVEMGRPSLLRLEAREGADGPRIRVGGRVVEVAQGELL
jgi:trans-2,3-dihydro-3-hydroxyanthranilate isomerase